MATVKSYQKLKYKMLIIKGNCKNIKMKKRNV